MKKQCAETNALRTIHVVYPQMVSNFQGAIRPTSILNDYLGIMFSCLIGDSSLSGLMTCVLFSIIAVRIKLE